ncbi:hypothetical protein JOF29_002823 [Kribbella aluminosa]|uniref:Uncharacterized protein n=1 Tax=Kribbella aluminosa TaxID=416017 RepID=A0ABS4UJA1_9ACTN|nr:hypothetical protein [Kribbella aluminosa]MBP2351740.1 hypothetical protein [Kribbella aluminosa]
MDASLRKVDRQLEQHFLTLGETSVVEDVWAIQMLTRRLDIEEQLRYWHDVREGEVGGPLAHTPETIRGGDYVRVSGHWRKVARVNQKSVTVETEDCGTGRAPYGDITGHRPADGPDEPLL